MRYTAVLFDLDGTLLDTLDDLADAVNWALGELHLPTRTREEVRKFVGNGARKLIERAVGEINAQYFDACQKLFQARYIRYNAVKTKPYDGIYPLLRALQDRAIAVGVVSNKFDSAVGPLCERYFGDLVQVAVGERPGFLPKPAPDSVRAAMNELRVAADKALYAGDSDVDIATAHNAGLPCISVSWGFRSRESLLAANADIVIDTPQDFLGAMEALNCRK